LLIVDRVEMLRLDFLSIEDITKVWGVCSVLDQVSIYNNIGEIFMVRIYIKEY